LDHLDDVLRAAQLLDRTRADESAHDRPHLPRQPEPARPAERRRAPQATAANDRAAPPRAVPGSLRLSLRSLRGLRAPDLAHSRKPRQRRRRSRLVAPRTRRTDAAAAVRAPAATVPFVPPPSHH